MAQVPQSLTKEGVYGVPVASGVVVRIDPNLRNGQGERLGLDEVDVSGAFLCININDDPNLPEYGTFDAQNISDAPALLRWSASSHILLFRKVNATPEATFGPNGADPSPFPPISLAGGGGGGGPDIYANRIVIGNALAGDDANSCDVLDAGDGVLLKATIEAAVDADIFIKQGDYTMENGLLPITIPARINVEAAGDQTNIIAQDNFNVFNMSERSRLANLKITFDWQGVPTAGTYGVSLADYAKLEGVNFARGVLPPSDNAALLGIIGGSALNAQVLDCEIDCLMERTNNPLGNGGVNAISATLINSIVRLNVISCDRGINILGRDNQIEITGTMGQLGDLQGSGQSLEMSVAISDPNIIALEGLLLSNLSDSEVTGSMIYRTPDQSGAIGLLLNNSIGATSPQRNRFSCIVEGFELAVSQVIGSDNKFVGCTFVSPSTGPVIDLQGGSEKTIIQGCSIVGDSTQGISCQSGANRTLISGNAINISGGGTKGIELFAGSTNTVPVGNSIEAATLIDDSSGDAPTNAAVLAAAALNI